VISDWCALVLVSCLPQVDIFANSQLGLLAFRKNITFFAIDMDRLALDDPALTRELLQEVVERFAAGDYQALPTTLFPMGQIREALELMKTGKHVGKVVLVNRLPDGSECPVLVDKPQNTFRPDISYLVTGGTGGFGHRLISYAIASGARHFIVSTSNADAQAVKAQAFADLLAQHPDVTIDVVACDTAKPEDVARLVDHARAVSPPVKAVFHVAGISKDATLPQMKDREFYASVAHCKALGAWMLHSLTLDMDLETFVTISSSAVLGVRGSF
jgi:FlaA1/EpsC-like NDP-sugar epimerase